MLTQKTNHKKLRTKLILALVTLLTLMSLPAPVFAVFSPGPPDTTAPATDTGTTDPACQKFLDPPNIGLATTSSKTCESETPAACKAIDRSTPKAETDFDNCLSQNSLISSNNPIIKDLNVIVDFLSAGIGIVITGTIILGGIQYSIAGNSPEAVGKAKKRIINGAAAFAVFMFIFAFLQWIVPGGVFNK